MIPQYSRHSHSFIEKELVFFKNKSKFILLIFISFFVFVALHYYMLPVKQNSPPEKDLSVIHFLATLILVPGHAIYLGDSFSSSCLTSDSCWILESFQQGQTKLFVEHIKKGVELTSKITNSLLIFSGGQTRAKAGRLSEGQSYFSLAHKVNWFGYHNVEARAATEEFARDSYENLLFSICRFYEITGNYPNNIITVGFKFKENRFIDLHREAIRFPLDKFTYVGVVDGITDSMVDSAAKDFQTDLYGCKGSLKTKRLNRNPFNRTHNYMNTCPEMADILTYCGNSKFVAFLPWNQNTL